MTETPEERIERLSADQFALEHSIEGHYHPERQQRSTEQERSK